MFGRFKRIPTIRVLIKDIKLGDFQDLQEGKRIKTPSGLSIIRVSIIGMVVNEFGNPERSFRSLIIDDGTDTIAVKAWRAEITLLSDIEVGDFVRVIGKVRESGDERFISPEIVSKIDDLNWETLHRLERLYAILTMGEKRDTSSEPIQDEATTISNEESSVQGLIVDDDSPLDIRILNIIRQGKTSGITYEQIVKSLPGISEDKIKDALRNLISEGEIYEPSQGKYKSLE